MRRGTPQAKKAPGSRRSAAPGTPSWPGECPVARPSGGSPRKPVPRARWSSGSAPFSCAPPPRGRSAGKTAPLRTGRGGPRDPSPACPGGPRPPSARRRPDPAACRGDPPPGTRSRAPGHQAGGKRFRGPAAHRRTSSPPRPRAARRGPRSPHGRAAPRGTPRGARRRSRASTGPPRRRPEDPGGRSSRRSPPRARRLRSSRRGRSRRMRGPAIPTSLVKERGRDRAPRLRAQIPRALISRASPGSSCTSFLNRPISSCHRASDQISNRLGIPRITTSFSSPA